jgi:pantothenate kinase type III
MSGFISRYKKRFGTVQVVMTGGDATLFAEHIKSSIFAAPNLIHIGLREILVFHAT